MISLTQGENLFTTISQNSTSDNVALYDKLANIEHRYLLQKYFSNEGSFSITTVGSQSLTLTGSLSVGATSATLSSAWTYYTTTVSVTFSSDEIRDVRVEKGSTSISWDAPLTETATTSIDVGGLQFYPLPPNYSKLKTVNINVGSLTYTPTEILTRQEWDKLNVFPYYGDIPNNYFIYPGGDKGAQIGIWPIPSTTGNTITFNYKFRIPDLSIADYTTPGSVSVAQGSTTVTGSGTTFRTTTNYPLESRWIQFSPTSSAATSGDNLWYQIASVDSTTQITLYTPYQGTSITSSSSYTIGQMPIIMEDFHDMLVWKALVFYFSSIVDNKVKKLEFEGLYKEKLELLSEYAGQKSINVNLGRGPNYLNPNLYGQNFGS